MRTTDQLAHDFRTPLSVIKACTEALLAGGLEDTEEARRFLRAMLRQTERLNKLVNRLPQL